MAIIMFYKAAGPIEIGGFLYYKQVAPLEQ